MTTVTVTIIEELCGFDIQVEGIGKAATHDEIELAKKISELVNKYLVKSQGGKLKSAPIDHTTKSEPYRAN